MDFEWDTWWLFIAMFLGILPFLVPRIKRLWGWYQRMQSGSDETLSEHITRIEEENKK